MSKLIEATYTHLATQIAVGAKQISFLTQERERIAKLFKEQDTEDDFLVGFVGEKLTNELDNAIRSIARCLEPLNDQLTQKLAEPVEEQLELGNWNVVVD